MKRVVKREKGITLIALVITIIVLLILAGVGIGELTGKKNSINESKDKTALSELTKIQQAVMETYIKYKQLGSTSYLIGTRMTYAYTQSEFNQMGSNESLKIAVSYDESNEIDPSTYYYKLDNNNLLDMGLDNINNNNEYIVNYSTGEVFNITQRKTINGEALYIWANN